MVNNTQSSIFCCFSDRLSIIISSKNVYEHFSFGRIRSISSYKISIYNAFCPRLFTLFYQKFRSDRNERFFALFRIISIRLGCKYLVSLKVKHRNTYISTIGFSVIFDGYFCFCISVECSRMDSKQ